MLAVTADARWLHESLGEHACFVQCAVRVVMLGVSASLQKAECNHRESQLVRRCLQPALSI